MTFVLFYFILLFSPQSDSGESCKGGMCSSCLLSGDGRRRNTFRSCLHGGLMAVEWEVFGPPTEGSQSNTEHRTRHKQHRHCTYSATLRRVRITVVAVGKEYYFSECVCSVSYPAWNAHAPYYIVICGLSGCAVFFYVIS
jgi:hypothetical protein